MSRFHNFKDSEGREFEASLMRESGRGVDTVYVFEEANYLDGEKEDVPSAEKDFTYYQDHHRISTIGAESNL